MLDIYLHQALPTEPSAFMARWAAFGLKLEAIWYKLSAF
jgi:hypothetical protein